MTNKLLVSVALSMIVASCAYPSRDQAGDAKAEAVEAVKVPEFLKVPESAKVSEDSLQFDLSLIRKTVVLHQAPRVTGSSGGACAAASRIFQRLNFVGMKKDHVLWVLRDPATISDAGVKAAPGVDAPLIYYFDGGFGGAAYELEFEDGCVKKVTRSSID